MQRTPLHIAVKEFRVKTAEFLVDNKADINSQDNDGVSLGDYLVMVYTYIYIFFVCSLSLLFPGTLKKGAAFTINFVHKIINTKRGY